MKNSSIYRYSSNQRKGIIALFFVIIIIQAGYYVFNVVGFSTKEKESADEKRWLAHQTEIDALKAQKRDKKDTIYPFNPNYITDYKGYVLGMSEREIDKLLAYRKSGKWINSVADFKQVTGVADSLLNKISPYFKFPDWVVKKQQEKIIARGSTDKPLHEQLFVNKYVNQKVQLDINNALEEDLIAVYGIGPAFAKKILRRRADLGAFVSMDQMADFKEFSPEAIAGLQKSFRVGANPQVNAINVNTASLQQLSHFPYFNKEIAKAIITQRSMKGKIDNFDELLKINQISTLKSKIISLYLEY
jgi:DNA uptake protein ComE-like DNA-binding protein